MTPKQKKAWTDLGKLTSEFGIDMLILWAVGVSGPWWFVIPFMATPVTYNLRKLVDKAGT